MILAAGQAHPPKSPMSRYEGWLKPPDRALVRSHSCQLEL